MPNNQTDQGKDYADEVFRRLAQQFNIPADDHTWMYEEDYLSYTLRIWLPGSPEAVIISFSRQCLDDCASPSNAREREKMEAIIRRKLESL